MSTFPPTWIMPHFSPGHEEALSFLHQAVQSILSQSDPDWRLIIVDDLSPQPARAFLKKLKTLSPKIHVIFQDTHAGAGLTRNRAIEWASGQGAPFLLFMDADDIAHPRRLEVTRKIFSEHPEATVVYSSFQVIDEKNQEVSIAKLTPMLVEIIESHALPPEGNNAWVRIATETGYTNLTSSTSVRTSLAVEQPFCQSQASEDAHCWLRYSAGGGDFIYTPDVPSLYRIPQNRPGGSSSRGLIGDSTFYALLSTTNEDGFKKAIALGLQKQKITEEKVAELTAKFYVRTAESMSKEGELELALDNIQKALGVNQQVTLEWVRIRGLGDKQWLQRVLTKTNKE